MWHILPRRMIWALWLVLIRLADSPQRIITIPYQACYLRECLPSVINCGFIIRKYLLLCHLYSGDVLRSYWNITSRFLFVEAHKTINRNRTLKNVICHWTLIIGTIIETFITWEWWLRCSCILCWEEWNVSRMHITLNFAWAHESNDICISGHYGGILSATSVNETKTMWQWCVACNPRVTLIPLYVRP